MSTPLPFTSLIKSAGPGRRIASVASSSLRLSSRYPSEPAICSNCLRNISGPYTQTRGKKTLPKATGVKVRLLKDIPEYGPKGSIMMVARGRMRTIWYQRGEAEYLTRELERSLGKYVMFERDPTYRPIERRPEEASVYNPMAEYLPSGVKDRLLSNSETVNILSSTLPPNISFYRTTILPTSRDIHGSVSTADIVNAIKLVIGASSHPDAGRVVITPENVTFVHDAGTARVKQTGEWEVDIGYKGEEPIRRTVLIVRDEDTDSPPVSSGASMGSQENSRPIFGNSASAREARRSL